MGDNAEGDMRQSVINTCQTYFSSIVNYVFMELIWLGNVLLETDFTWASLLNGKIVYDSFD